ncbi:hypothetical protein PTMSG1_06186 [Pyrenophora teres f. maculata]|nr:hypothetical protein PTMSG1_06186 [Pyrenophora teres f. maculata]
MQYQTLLFSIACFAVAVRGIAVANDPFQAKSLATREDIGGCCCEGRNACLCYFGVSGGKDSCQATCPLCFK